MQPTDSLLGAPASVAVATGQSQHLQEKGARTGSTRTLSAKDDLQVALCILHGLLHHATFAGVVNVSTNKITKKILVDTQPFHQCMQGSGGKALGGFSDA